MIFVFWLMLFLVVYCYIGYPVLIAAAARFLGRPVQPGTFEPAVSIVISVHNEEDVILRKLENLTDLDYPPEKMEILIGSDGSSDRTNEQLKSFQTEKKFRPFLFDDRRGKPSVLNDLLAEASGEVIVFTDARQSLGRDAVRRLAEDLHDPAVGCVSGELVLAGAEGGTSRGVRLYWEYEKSMRENESRVHSMLGATGALYAIRKNLFDPLPPDIVLDDMFTPLTVIRKGYRAVFSRRAKVFDLAAQSAREEHRRKSRTLYGNFQIFRLFADLLAPWKSPVAIQLISHKFLRVAAPLILIALFCVNAALIGIPFYGVFFAAQIVFYGMAAAGAFLRNARHGVGRVIGRLCYAPYVFCLLNFSALTGFFRYLTSSQAVTWEKAREHEKVS